jgi:hypothetical protein
MLCIHLRLILRTSRFLYSYHKYLLRYVDRGVPDRRGVLKIHHVGLMAPWVYNKKFSMGTQFLLGTLMFTTGEDGNLKLSV